MDVDDRREFLRVLARIPISCMAVDENGRAALIRVRSVDLSAGGVSVVTDRPLAVGQRVRLSFRAGDAPETLRIDANVVRADRRPDEAVRYGLEFPGLAPFVERRLVQAVYAQERANASRHERVRMSLWEPVRCRLHNRRKINAHATSMSTDDLCIVTRHQFRAGDRVHVEMDDNGSGVRIEAWASVSDTQPDGRGNLACTLLFDQLDRVTRSAILRNLMEAERQHVAGS
ncbi:MAG: PilZ domain-containing protein [Gaiellales bacterium]